MPMHRKVKLIALPLIGLGLLGACSLVADPGSYCREQGYSQGTPAFEQCVTNRQAEANRYRSGRHGGRGQGAGG